MNKKFGNKMSENSYQYGGNQYSSQGQQSYGTGQNQYGGNQYTNQRESGWHPGYNSGGNQYTNQRQFGWYPWLGGWKFGWFTNYGGNQYQGQSGYVTSPDYGNQYTNGKYAGQGQNGYGIQSNYDDEVDTSQDYNEYNRYEENYVKDSENNLSTYNNSTGSGYSNQYYYGKWNSANGDVQDWRGPYGKSSGSSNGQQVRKLEKRK